MALLFLDSFDHYLDASDKYLGGSTGPVVGRHGSGWSGTLRCALIPASHRCLVGMAFQTGATVGTLLDLRHHTATMCSIQLRSEGAVGVALFGGATVWSAADTVRLGRWHYLECDFTVLLTPAPALLYSIDPLKIYLDGLLVIDSVLAPGDFGSDAVYGWAVVDLLPNAAATIDDLYILDGSGPAPHNAPLGDVQVDVIRPNGAGALTEWTPVGAATNFGCVDDTTPDDEATKIIAATAGLSDLYQMEDVNTSNGIIGAQILISARRTEEGFAQLTPLLRHAGTTTELTTRSISPSYFYRNRECFVTMPNGDPLTDANVNALQAGCKRTV